MGAQTYLPVEILDYVETHAPPPDSVFGISQRELAKALGYHPCSMSRPLESLVTGGLLASRRGLVRDGERKQLVYSITEPGRARLRRETREVPLLSGEIPPPPHPFLGRKDELAQLAEYSREGRGIIFVDGPPGMGKSALVSRHIRQIKRGRVPFWFTVHAASSPRQFVSALSHALSFLGAPQLAYYTQLPRGPVPREVADLVARALGARSLAAVVDDFHLASADLRKFIGEFVLSIIKKREDLFFLVGQESSPFDTGNLPARTLTIGGLDRAAAHDLTDRQGGLADRFESVYQSTLGSPLLLQLAVLNPGVTADPATLPSAVLKRLPAEELRAILPAALSNEPLPITFLSATEGLTEARLVGLTHMGILHETLQGRVEVLQVVRAALLARATPSDEREAHLRLATFYSRSHRPEAVRERFLHLVEGESWKVASQLLMQQERVILRLGYSETLRNALRHLATVLPHGQAKFKVLLVEAALLRLHSDYSEAVLSLRRALTEAGSDPRMAAECRLGMVDLYFRMRELEQARNEFEEARKIGAQSRRLQAYFVLTEARLAEAAGDLHTARRRYQGAFELARRFKASDLALESIAAWSRLAEIQSGADAGLPIIGEALPEARKAGRMDIVFNLLLVRSRAYAETGREDLAESEMKAIRSEAESLGYINQLAYALSGLASMAVEGRRWEEAISYAKQAGALAERLGNDLVFGHTLSVMCDAEYRQADSGGDPNLINEALAHGLRSLDVLGRLPPSDSMVLAHSYLAEVYAFRKEQAPALEHYRAALELADQLELNWLKDRLVEEVGTLVGRLALPENRGVDATAGARAS
jgi:tetratricopeptide (TPR) repeat protein/DNA-binding MarR family transcriptional regulator